MITNTSKSKRTLLDAIPGAIEASEKRGQDELVNSTQLPTRFLSEGDKEKLEAAGVVFGAPSEDDPLFCEVTLPDGWKLEPTEHPMWSKLKDGDGKEWAAIFYKAAFYDRRAHISAEQ